MRFWWVNHKQTYRQETGGRCGQPDPDYAVPQRAEQSPAKQIDTLTACDRASDRQ